MMCNFVAVPKQDAASFWLAQLFGNVLGPPTSKLVIIGEKVVLLLIKSQLYDYFCDGYSSYLECNPQLLTIQDNTINHVGKGSAYYKFGAGPDVRDAESASGKISPMSSPSSSSR